MLFMDHSIYYSLVMYERPPCTMPMSFMDVPHTPCPCYLWTTPIYHAHVIYRPLHIPCPCHLWITPYTMPISFMDDPIYHANVMYGRPPYTMPMNTERSWPCVFYTQISTSKFSAIINCLADWRRWSCFSITCNLQQRVSIDMLTPLHVVTNGCQESSFPLRPEISPAVICSSFSQPSWGKCKEYYEWTLKTNKAFLEEAD